MADLHPLWIVTASGDRPVAETAAALTKAGFSVDAVLGEIGVITGRCAESKVAALRRVPGVADVAPDGKLDIGPPDTPHTW